jgi:2'-5' RNA ligase
MNQRRRIFIAINIPQNIKNLLKNYPKKWPDLPVKWVKPENLHITLSFIGYVNNDELLDICKTVNDVVLKSQPFSIGLKEICYGPLGKMPPRMVWVIGEKNEQLNILKNNLEKSLNGKSYFSPENKNFIPHITLGRIKQWEFRRMEPDEIDDIREEIDAIFSVDSIEIMESHLKRGGAEYAVLESIPLGDF